MSHNAVAQHIADLDALSRSRVLTNVESWRLQRLVTVQRRYDSAKSKSVVAP